LSKQVEKAAGARLLDTLKLKEDLLYISQKLTSLVTESQVALNMLNTNLIYVQSKL